MKRIPKNYLDNSIKDSLNSVLFETQTDLKIYFFSVGFHAQGGEQIHTEKQQVSRISKVSQ
jgi:hypothetical protein